MTSVRLTAWTKNLKTGHKKIDEQHQELFKQFDAFIQARLGGEGGKEARKIMVFLQDYTKKHFYYEENLYKRKMYPQIAAHRAEHEKFIENLRMMKKDCKKQCDIAAAGELNELLGGWFRSHILDEDIKVVNWIEAEENKSASG